MDSALQLHNEQKRIAVLQTRKQFEDTQKLLSQFDSNDVLVSLNYFQGADKKSDVYFDFLKLIGQNWRDKEVEKTKEYYAYLDQNVKQIYALIQNNKLAIQQFYRTIEQFRNTDLFSKPSPEKVYSTAARKIHSEIQNHMLNRHNLPSCEFEKNFLLKLFGHEPTKQLFFEKMNFWPEQFFQFYSAVEKLHKKYIETFAWSSPWQRTQLADNLFSWKEIKEHSGLENKVIKAIFQEFSQPVPSQSITRNPHLVRDNNIHKTPVFIYQKKYYVNCIENFLFSMRFHFENKLDHYKFTEQSFYFSRRGKIVEQMTFEAVQNLLPQAFVKESFVYVLEQEDKETIDYEIDVLVIYKQKCYLIECKSFKDVITLPAIFKSCEQIVQATKSLKHKTAILGAKDKEIKKHLQSVKEFCPLVVFSVHCDFLNNLQKEISTVSQTLDQKDLPTFLGIFDLCTNSSVSKKIFFDKV